ncbi:hypothetical protein BDU57DRAFT_210409 [Ampelomyces quisqualis]|uniref:Uncharacterized protein n=1 Tax=Ampelomyces quisqualis TaxID=50730 RepID=A0A6A5QMK8_AMPQU|nr:hypothetical protein BDU57DRAFT_210409 [Ampelomyces quisqualis]
MTQPILTYPVPEVRYARNRCTASHLAGCVISCDLGFIEQSEMWHERRFASIFATRCGWGTCGLVSSREAVFGPSLGAVVAVGVKEPREGDQAKKATVLPAVLAVNQVFRPPCILERKHVPGKQPTGYAVGKCWGCRRSHCATLCVVWSLDTALWLHVHRQSLSHGRWRSTCDRSCQTQLLLCELHIRAPGEVCRDVRLMLQQRRARPFENGRWGHRGDPCDNERREFLAKRATQVILIPFFFKE